MKTSKYDKLKLNEKGGGQTKHELKYIIT